MMIHHVGYLVKSIEKAIMSFEKLGISRYGDVVYDAERKAHICFLGRHHEVELVSPSKESELFSLLSTYKNVPYHVCYRVNDIYGSIEEFVKKGFLLIKDVQKAPAISNDATVAFLMNAQIGIVELVED